MRARRQGTTITAFAAVSAAVAAGLGVASLGGPRWSSAAAVFWIVSLAAGACVVLAVWVLAVGYARGAAEVALLGTGLTTVSVLTLVHGLTAPGYLYGPSPASETAMVVALPSGLLAALPVVLGSGRMTQWTRAWRGWCVVATATTVAVTVGMLADPGRTPALSDATAQAVILGPTYVVLAVLVRRQLVLHAIGRRPASLAAAAALVGLGFATAAGIFSAPDSLVWWLAHGVDAAGVLVALIAVGVAYRYRRSIDDMLAPVLARDTLVALELGLAPEVHAFVAALERKDAMTRDHVVRVAELAMRVGERAGLEPRRLRVVGLGALMHDIGKLVVPSDVLTKPGGLTAEEYAVMQEHTVRGAALLGDSPALADVAPVVRGHHERHDGTGYPDGRRGDEIPIETAIVSVVDAWDAMVADRVYRPGMAPDDARAVLLEHADRQWSRTAVELVLAEVGSEGPRAPTALRDVGRRDGSECDAAELAAEVCADAVPPSRAEVAVG